MRSSDKILYPRVFIGDVPSGRCYHNACNYPVTAPSPFVLVFYTHIIQHTVGGTHREVAVIMPVTAR